MAGQVEHAVLLYDEECGFCRWSVAKVLAWDRAGRLRPLAIQSAAGRRLLADMPEAERLGSWHLVEAGGRTSGGAAAAPLLRLLPGGGPAAAVAARLPGAAERGYGWVARHRGAVGMLITPGAERRAGERIRRRARAARAMPPAAPARERRSGP